MIKPLSQINLESKKHFQHTWMPQLCSYIPISTHGFNKPGFFPGKKPGKAILVINVKKLPGWAAFLHFNKANLYVYFTIKFPATEAHSA